MNVLLYIKGKHIYWAFPCIGLSVFINNSRDQRGRAALQSSERGCEETVIPSGIYLHESLWKVSSSLWISLVSFFLPPTSDAQLVKCKIKTYCTYTYRQMCTNTCTHPTNSKAHTYSAPKGQWPFKQFTAKSLSHLCALTLFFTNTLHAHNSCSSDSHEWKHWAIQKWKEVKLEEEQENWRDTEFSQNNQLLMRCHFISSISSL